MPAAVSENTREMLFGAAHANRRCSERREVRRLLPSSRKGGRKAWLRPGRRKTGTAGGKRLRNRQAIRERLSGRNRRLTGPGRRKRNRGCPGQFSRCDALSITSRAMHRECSSIVMLVASGLFRLAEARLHTLSRTFRLARESRRSSSGFASGVPVPSGGGSGPKAFPVSPGGSVAASRPPFRFSVCLAEATLSVRLSGCSEAAS